MGDRLFRQGFHHTELEWNSGQYVLMKGIGRRLLRHRSSCARFEDCYRWLSEVIQMKRQPVDLSEDSGRALRPPDREKRSQEGVDIAWEWGGIFRLGTDPPGGDGLRANVLERPFMKYPGSIEQSLDVRSHH